MNEKIKEQIKQYLIENELVETWEEQEELNVEYGGVDVNPDDIAETETGVKYNRRLALAYMKDNGYQLSPENIELVAKKFGVEKIMVKKKNAVVHSEIDNIDDNDLNTLIGFNILKKLTTLKKVEYEYSIESVRDSGGVISIGEAQTMLAQKALAGWRLKEVVSNEMGKNAVSVAGVGVNSTSNILYFIFERQKE